MHLVIGFLLILQILKMPYALKRNLPKDHKDLKRVGQKAVQAIEGLVNILLYFPFTPMTPNHEGHRYLPFHQSPKCCSIGLPIDLP